MWAMMEKLRMSFVSVMGDLAYSSFSLAIRSSCIWDAAYQLGLEFTSPERERRLRSPLFFPRRAGIIRTAFFRQRTSREIERMSKGVERQTVLYLIRHGATEANLARPPRLQGQRHNPPL